MPNNNNLIPKENYKQVEEVREIDNEMPSVVGDQIPTFEEFMQTYEFDDNLNYDDLNDGDIGEGKGYGPCSYSGCPYNTYFYLKIGFSQRRLFNWHFREGDREFEWIICKNIKQARAAKEKLYDGTYRVAGATGDSTTTSANNKKADVLLAFQFWMIDHEEGGKKVNEEVDLNERRFSMFEDEEGCSIN